MLIDGCRLSAGRCLFVVISGLLWVVCYVVCIVCVLAVRC